MSENPFIKPFSISIESSFQKTLIVFIPHLIGLFLTFISVLLIWLKILLVIAILISFYYYLQLHITQKLKKSVIAIQQDSTSNWFITLSGVDGKSEPKSVTLLPTSFISKVLIVLNYRDDNRSYYSVLLSPDSLSNNKFKHLTSRLKIINTKNS